MHQQPEATRTGHAQLPVEPRRLPDRPDGRYYLYTTDGNGSSNSRRTWAFSILPFIEQATIGNAINFNLSFSASAQYTVLKARVAAFDCPTDPGKDNLEDEGKATVRVKGNYAVNWGNVHYEQDQGKLADGSNQPNPYATGPAPPATYLPAPFAPNISTGPRDFVDGMSNTLLMAEVVNPFSTALDIDHRGDIYNDDRNCAMFMAYTPPNSPIPDQLPTTSSSSYCANGYMTNPPCIGKDPAGQVSTLAAFNAARSFHHGGVNALLADGSVRFSKNTIDLPTWRALATMGGGEVVSADQF